MIPSKSSNSRESLGSSSSWVPNWVRGTNPGNPAQPETKVPTTAAEAIAAAAATPPQQASPMVERKRGLNLLPDVVSIFYFL